MAKKAKPLVTDTTDYRHPTEKRTNIPPAKIASEGAIPRAERVRYAYSPHLSPLLQFDSTGKADKVIEKVEELLDKATKYPLTLAEATEVRELLANQQPWLEWAGRREQQERGWFEVDPVALHIHERVSARACIRSALREDVQKDLFADPQQPYRQAVQFYRHDIDWTNRLILGDSLQVMSSLGRRENLAGKVQMIYLDPPYGIKFASNFQVEVGSREVSEKDVDLARELEVVRAYRDSWALGYHSYLSYLRDRLVAARELLAPEGSLFLQIGAENVHRVRDLLDSVFGPRNFVAQITVKKTATPRGTLDDGCFYILWYSRSAEHLSVNPLFASKPCDEWARDTPGGSWGAEVDCVRRPLTPEEKYDTNLLPANANVYCFSKLTSAGKSSTPEEFAVHGQSFKLKANEHWKTTQAGLARLVAAERIEVRGRPWFVKYYRDGQFKRLNNIWEDTAGKSGESLYVVQTQLDVVQRCMLLATKPGDLVLDPTCGSGTTAAVAERWGRRWITIDTSRVALAIARQRLLTSKFEHFRTLGGPLQGNEQAENPDSGFRYRKVPHITLRSIAQNGNLDPIFAKHAGALAAALDECNRALQMISPEARRRMKSKLETKERSEGKKAVTAADLRRWILPASAFQSWNMPVDVDPEWPPELLRAVKEYLGAWREKVQEVNACVEQNADQVDLVDQPEVVKGVVRVSGPFTVEGVRPEELSLGEEGLFDGTPNEFEAEESGPDPRLTNLHAYLTKMVQSLRGDGLTFLNNKRQKFARVESLFESATGSVLHAEGIWEKEGAAGDELLNEPATVAITFGPQYGPVSAQQVEEAIRASKRYDELVVAGFSFDAEASAVIEESSHPKLRIHAAYIRPDINPGMDGLLKETPGSQLFTVFGQPDVEVDRSGEDWVVELKGVDIYDPVANTVRSTGADKVAAWFLDQDFDGRTFCITQAFFPDQDAWEKLAKALKGSADPEAFEAFKGTKSLPFSAGKHNRVAVKVIDPRGNEVMSIRKLEG